MPVSLILIRDLGNDKPVSSLAKLASTPKVSLAEIASDVSDLSATAGPGGRARRPDVPTLLAEPASDLHLALELLS